MAARDWFPSSIAIYFCTAEALRRIDFAVRLGCWTANLAQTEAALKLSLETLRRLKDLARLGLAPKTGVSMIADLFAATVSKSFRSWFAKDAE